MKMKIVPLNAPGSEGEWRDVPPELAEKVEAANNWIAQQKIVAHLAPSGHCIIQFKGDNDRAK